jgi:uncharacterized damage-inducible protein DinB
MENELLKIWHKNHKQNIILLEAISEENLHKTANPKGSGSAEYQLKHLYNVRFWKLEALDKKSVEGFNSLKKEEVLDKETLKDLLEITNEKIITLIHKMCDDERKINKSPLDLVAYFINHEAHHRGNILLNLKLSGVKIAQETKYQLWDWNKL